MKLINILYQPSNIDYSNVDNELDDIDDKVRQPSNTINNEGEDYSPEDKVKTWDYQNIIDRHDKHNNNKI